jgi:methionine sulfoxide reductase heme-binding subunit
LKKALLFLLCLSPLFYLLYRLFTGSADDPVKYIYTLTGYSALALLYATTLISLAGRKLRLMRYRRMIGLFVFFYALLHFLNFFVFDMELNLVSALHETLKKPFIYLGMSAFLILLFMAVTSWPSLFAKYVRYHQLIYVALLLATVHFVMAQKALGYQQWMLLAAMAAIGLLKLLQKSRVWRH